MSETAGGAHDYQPRHAAAQLDDHLLEFLATSADEYRYAQMEKQYDAEYAIERARLLSSGDADVGFIGAQQLLIAKSLGRQAAAKTYAEELRSQLYYAPQDGNYYHGRHRLEDRPVPEKPGEGRHRKDSDEDAAVPEQILMPAVIFESMVRALSPPEPSSHPPPPSEPPSTDVPGGPRHYDAPSQGRLAHIIDEGSLGPSADHPPKEARSASRPFPVSPEPEDGYFPESPQPPAPPPLAAEPDEPPPGAVPPQREKRGPLASLRHAWYAGMAAVNSYFFHPDKGGRRRTIARVAVVVGGVAAIGLASWLGSDLGDQPPPPPDIAEPAGPPPNTEQFFDTIQPGDRYHGEPYEWGAAANNLGAAEATPSLLRLIDYARDGGLVVDTWGDPDCGRWGINSVTVELPDGTMKSYYDTPRKLAILQWYAGGMGPNQ